MTTGTDASEVARDTATVLLHVALADGNADAAEITRIQSILAHQAKRRGIDAPEVNADSVTAESFTQALGRLAGMPNSFKAALVNHATVIAGVDDNIEESEAQTISAIASGLFDGDQVQAALWFANGNLIVRKAEAALGLHDCS